MKITDFYRKKQLQEKIRLLTCYDYPSARIIAETSIDAILVGDSVAMAVHGHPTTLTATLDMMCLHTEAVARGRGQQFLISDLPFLCHKGSLSETIAQVRRLMQAGAEAIKIEGGDPDTCQTIEYLVTAGVPVMGHLGLRPQSINQLGGYKVQGKLEAEAEQILLEARNLQKAGCFALVLECIPAQLATAISKDLAIPTIGIGAGPNTDGQVLVWHDLLGLQDEFSPKFLKRFAQAKPLFIAAINEYSKQVQHVHYPDLEHAF